MLSFVLTAKSRLLMHTRGVFFQMFPDIRKSNALFEGSQSSPAGPPIKSSIMIKMTVQYWWSISNRKNEILGENPSRCERTFFFPVS